MKPIVLFGCGKIAEVLLYFFRHHSNREVVASCVDSAYLPGNQWQGLPTVAFEVVTQRYPAISYDMFVALGYQDINGLREAKCRAARKLGYNLASYVHPNSGLPTGCAHGDNCFFMNQVHVQPYASFGNNVFIWSGAMVGHHSYVGDNCWITSSAQIAGGVTVGVNTFLAINATVGNSISIGARCYLGANSLVTKSTLDDQVFVTESSKPFRLTTQQFFRLSRIGEY